MSFKNLKIVLFTLAVSAVIMLGLWSLISGMKYSHGNGDIEADIEYIRRVGDDTYSGSRYEYMVIETNIDVTPAKQLNEFGEYGWLLLQVQRVPPSGKIYLTFAREKQ